MHADQTHASQADDTGLGAMQHASAKRERCLLLCYIHNVYEAAERDTNKG